jgi:hypothetical protein
LAGTISDDLEASADVTSEVLDLLGGVVAAEEARRRHIVEAAHFELGNYETVVVDRVNYLAGVHVGVGLNDCELGLLPARELLPCRRVAVVNNLELSGSWL